MVQSSNRMHSICEGCKTFIIEMFPRKTFSKIWNLTVEFCCKTIHHLKLEYFDVFTLLRINSILIWFDLFLNYWFVLITFDYILFILSYQTWSEGLQQLVTQHQKQCKVLSEKTLSQTLRYVIFHVFYFFYLFVFKYNFIS